MQLARVGIKGVSMFKFILIGFIWLSSFQLSAMDSCTKDCKLLSFVSVTSSGEMKINRDKLLSTRMNQWDKAVDKALRFDSLKMVSELLKIDLENFLSEIEKLEDEDSQKSILEAQLVDYTNKYRLVEAYLNFIEIKPLESIRD